MPLWLASWCAERARRRKKPKVFVKLLCQSKEVDDLHNSPKPWYIARDLDLENIPVLGSTLSIAGVRSRIVTRRILDQGDAMFSATLICDEDPLTPQESIHLIANHGWYRL